MAHPTTRPTHLPTRPAPGRSRRPAGRTRLLAALAVAGAACAGGVAGTLTAPGADAAGPTAASGTPGTSPTCAVAFAAGSTDPMQVKKDEQGYLLGAAAVDATAWGRHFAVSSPTRDGYVIRASIRLTVPDGCRPGSQAWVDLPAGFHVRGASSLAPVTDDDGATIATVSTQTAPGLRREATRLVLTLTDYVTTHRGITATYGFQVQEGQDNGIKADLPVTAHLKGSDGSSLNELRWRFGGNRFYSPYAAAGWSGNATTPDGTVDVHSFTSWTGKEEVDMAITVGAGSRWDCTALTSRQEESRFGVGLVDVGAERHSAPTSATLLAPSAYQLTCSEREIRVHVPPSAWTSADASSGQLVRVFAKRVADGDSSWLRNGGVAGMTEIKQTGHPVSSHQWFSLPPGSKGSGQGVALRKAVPAAPTLSKGVPCGKRPMVTTARTEGVTYKVETSKDGGKATVTAQVAAGYYVPAGEKTSWEVAIPAAQACPATTTVKPSDKPTTKPADKPTGKRTEKPSETPADKPTDKPTSKPSATTQAPAPATEPTTPAATQASGSERELARTGTHTLGLAVLAAGLASGGVVLLLRRRRRP